jgi:hypothetical protein
MWWVPDFRPIFAMRYSLSSEDRLLKVQVEDTLTKRDILDLWEAIEAYPPYQTAAAGLVHLGYRLKWDISGDEIADLAKRAVRLRPIPYAFVVRDAVSFGMVRMFAAYAQGGGTYYPFEIEDSGREWLRPFLSPS